MNPQNAEGYRLSVEQQRLWMVQEAAGGRANRAFLSLVTEGPLQPDRLAAAVRSVIERHEILRTTFRKAPGMALPLQIIAETPDFAMEVAPITTGPASLEESLRREWDRPLDLQNGPTLRVSLMPLSSLRHRILIGLPALCADPVSLRILTRELVESYREEGSPDEPAPLQYADYAEWQNALRETGEDAAAGVAFWSAAGVAPARRLADAASRSTGIPAASAVSLDPELSERMSSLARSEGVSRSVLLFAAWSALLARATPSDVLSLPYLFEGRGEEGLDTAVGLFARDLPVRLAVKREESFAAHVARVARALREAEEWQEFYPLPPRRAGEASVLETRPGFECTEWGAPREAGGVSFAFDRHHFQLQPFALKLAALEKDGAIELALQHDPKAFTADRIDRMGEQLATLLRSAVQAPATAVGALEAVGKKERERVLVTLNRTAVTYPDLSFHRLFESQSSRAPKAVALVSSEGALGYGELNAQANRLARLLRRKGVGEESIVALCLPPSHESIVGMLGILKAGGAYLALNPDHPPARIAALMSAARARVAICGESLIAALGEAAEVVSLERDAAALAREDSGNLEDSANPQDVAYVIYTSGSTGVPKGVAVTHSNLANYIHFIDEKLRGNGGTPPSGMHFATVSTLAADLGNTSVHTALAFGGCLHLLPTEVSADAARFTAYAREHPLDVLKIVPSHLAALLEAGAGAEVLPRRHLILGGEMLPWSLVDSIAATGARCAVLNHYGPTETTVGSLTFDVPMGEKPAAEPASVPIGGPVANTEVYILDDDLRLVPWGGAGELYIGGKGVARGYVGAPERTAERFVPDSFGAGGGGRLYRTGDRVRRLPDGAIEFLGRRDHQVKVRGFRVELEELEIAMRQHPGVRDAAAVLHRAEGEPANLVGYFVPAGAPSPSASELRVFLHERLPDYMVPSLFQRMDRFPATPAGKVDRRALPAPNREDSERSEEFIAPRTPDEETIARIWREVLRVERVGVRDNFFDLGGHSLIATQIVSRVRSAFQVELPLRSLFEGPTVEGLAAAIARSPVLSADTATPIARHEEGPEGLLARIDELSDEQVDALLKEMGAGEEERP